MKGSDISSHSTSLIHNITQRVTTLLLFLRLLGLAADFSALKQVVTGAVSSWLVRSSSDRTVGARAWRGVIVLCASLHVTLVYKWLPESFG